MEISKLKWDSDFFGLSIGSFRFFDDDFVSADILLGHAERQDLDLAYIFMPQDTCEKKTEILTNLGAVLVDQKITYQKVTPNYPLYLPEGVREYEGQLNSELLELAYLSGHMSRFKRDKRLTSRFKLLYKLWIEKSISSIFADKLFIYKEEDKILGIITCELKDEVGIIGLIATSPETQGRGIGTLLLNAAQWYFQQCGAKKIIVATQKNNSIACKCYLKFGFNEENNELVFHWWL